MKIVELRAENVKCLKAVEVRPIGSVVEVRGRNGQGKSSLIDAIAYALGGKPLCPEMPIRAGQDHANVVVKFDGLVVRRTWTPTDTYLTVENEQGAAYRTPQAILDKLVGNLTFDPLEFVRMKPQQRRDELLALLGLREKLVELDTREGQLSVFRRDAHKEVERLKALLATLASIPEDTPDTPLSLIDLTRAQQAAMAKKAAIDRRHEQLEQKKEAREESKRTLAQKEGELKALRQRIKDAEDTVILLTAELEAQIVNIRAETDAVAKLKPPDMSQFEAEAERMQRINVDVGRKQQRVQTTADLQAAEHIARQREKDVESVRDERNELFRQAHFPIEGLGVSAGVTFRGIPFDQCASSEQLLVALAIGMARNPKLRILLIRDGSLLDDESLALVYQTVQDHDYQLWIERVGEDGQGSGVIVIEDGTLKQDGPPKVEAPAMVDSETLRTLPGGQGE